MALIFGKTFVELTNWKSKNKPFSRQFLPHTQCLPAQPGHVGHNDCYLIITVTLLCYIIVVFCLCVCVCCSSLEAAHSRGVESASTSDSESSSISESDSEGTTEETPQPSVSNPVKTEVIFCMHIYVYILNNRTHKHAFSELFVLRNFFKSQCLHLFIA